MNVRPALKSQYKAALKTLHEAIEKCPDSLWSSATDNSAPFWRAVYHTLYFAHFYALQETSAFTPWAKHREEAQFMTSVPWEPHGPPKEYEPYTRAELLEYCDDCLRRADARIDALDLSAPQCGFPWYQMSTFEHQLVNIRHIQHHAAILSSRLRQAAGITVGWVGEG